MGSQRSKEDEVQKISTSMFVTIFPDQFTAKELWNTCKQYGYVVDAFIPNRISKAGKRFGFVHFINVFDAEHLVNNLCTIWVGRHKIHANVARFQRVSMNNSSSQFKNNEEKRNHTHDVSIDKGTKGPVNSYVHPVKGPQSINMGMESNPVKEFASLTNLKVALVSEGFDNVKLRYMGGFWVMLEFSSEEVKMKFHSSVGIGTWFSQLQQASSDFIIDGRVTWVELEGIPLKIWSENTFKRIASKWGVLLHVDDQEERCFHRKRVCINTTGYFSILESFKIIYQGKAYWVRAKKVPSRVPDFIEENDEVDESDDESFEGEPNGDNLNNGDDVRGDSKIDEVPDTIFEEKLSNTNGDESSDDDSFKYPPSFTLRDDIEGGEVQSIKRNVPVDERDEGTHIIHEEVEASGAKKSDLKKNSKGD
ncbi:nucleotide-binding alpha-beta plait domain-containing protein, partial [Tanacetum coccineum]